MIRPVFEFIVIICSIFAACALILWGVRYDKNNKNKGG